MSTATVYVELLDEGVPVWRPVEAEELGDGQYKLLPTDGYDPELETWAFLPGTVVRCEKGWISTDPALVAVEQS